MPQAMNMKTADTPYGKGSLHNALLESTFRTRRRAAQINRGEASRLHLTEKMMSKHEQADRERKSKIIGGIQRRIEELNAYKSVLKSYSSDNLETLQWGFKPRNIESENSFQRYKLETKIYHSGFTVGTLYPEIKKAIVAGKPERLKENFRDKLLVTSKRRSDFMIDRKWTDQAMRRERKIAHAESHGLFLTSEDTTMSKMTERGRTEMVKKESSR